MTGGKSDISTKVKNKNSENVINDKFDMDLQTSRFF